MSQKLTIAFVCDPIGSNKSGVVISTIRFAQALKERGHKVIFIGAQSDEHVNPHFQGIKAYLYRSLPIPKGGGWRLAFPTVAELKKVFKEERIDIVHVNLPMSGAIVAVKAAKALGIKVVSHSHSQPENLFMDAPKMMRGVLGNLWNKYLIWFYSKADFIIYPTQMAKSLLENPKITKPSAVVSNGINLEEFRPKEVGDFYERFGLEKEGIKLLFVGRIYPEKSLDTLIKSMPIILKDYPETHLMLVGAGHFRPKLEFLIKKLKIESAVSFLGLLSDEDRLDAYNACDIFTFPSVAELEGMAVLEAMACGKPIVVSDAEMSASRFFVKGNGFLFKARDAADLALQIIKLISNAGLRREMGQKSLEVARSYDIQKSIDKLEQIYFSILKS